MKDLFISINNVSLRPFLFLIDVKNKGKEFSNTTVCNYYLEKYATLFNIRYKSKQSFQSGYAGNFSLLFDSDDSQNGKLNKNTKQIPEELINILPNLKNLTINIDEKYCHIGNIPDDDTFELLSVFFCLKRINATINKVVSIDNPQNTWVKKLAEKLNKKITDFPANQNQITGRGDIGRRSTLNRYTIYNRGNNWFDVIKPNYYDFKQLRYKIFLHNLMIEQHNVYFCIIKNAHYNFDYKDVFKNGIIFDDNEPHLNYEWIKKQITIEDVLLVKKDDLRNLILNQMVIPPSYQFVFNKIIGNTLHFSDGTTLDLSPILVTDFQTLLDSSNLNPNITIDTQLESKLIELTKSKNKTITDEKYQIQNRALNGEESNTIKEFLDLNYEGKLKFRDYSRGKDNSIEFSNEKTCLILYNETKYPDLVCIFLEDAEKIEKKGKRTFIEYSNYIWSNYERFKHLMFQVEAEFNLTSFKEHDESREKVLQSKYIFCENKYDDYYESKFNVRIPVVSIKDF